MKFLGFLGLLVIAALIVANARFPNSLVEFTISNTRTAVGIVVILFFLIYAAYFSSARILHHLTESADIAQAARAEKYARYTIWFQKSLVSIRLTLLVLFVIYIVKLYQIYATNNRPEGWGIVSVLVLFLILSSLILGVFARTRFLSERIGYLQRQFQKIIDNNDKLYPQDKLFSPSRGIFALISVLCLVVILLIFIPAWWDAVIAMIVAQFKG